MAEVFKIIECYALQRFVMTEKFPVKTKIGSTYYHFSPNPKEKNYKLIYKNEDGTFKRVLINLDHQEAYIKEDLKRLERDLDLNEYNVLSDGYDINQAIKYYSNLPNIEL